MLTTEKSLHLTAEDSKLGNQRDLVRQLQLCMTNALPSRFAGEGKDKWISSR
jgi:hypothetical protein